MPIANASMPSSWAPHGWCWAASWGAILYVVVTGRTGAEIGSFATNGYGEHSPGGYGLLAAAVIEVVMTFGFVTVIVATTDRRAHAAARGWRSGSASP